MNRAKATGRISDYSSPATDTMHFPIRARFCLAVTRFDKTNLSLIDNLQYYRKTQGAINYSDCVLTESSGVLSLPVILLKTFDRSSEGVAPSETAYVSGPSGRSSFYPHIRFNPTQLSWVPSSLWSLFALAPLFSELHKHSSQQPEAINGLKSTARTKPPILWVFKR